MEEYRKWDEAMKVYKPYTVPDSWKLLCYSNDMDETCNCAQCGREMRFGDGYASAQVQTAVGFGYAICADRCVKELQERRDAGRPV